MKTKELKALHNNELQEKLVELRKGLMKEKAQISIGAPPKNPGNVRAMKRSIARIVTILHQKPVKSIKPLEKKEVA